MGCAHFTAPDHPCARGVNLQALAGGGAFYMVMRLPCIDISNRRGEQAKPCNQFIKETDHEKAQQEV